MPGEHVREVEMTLLVPAAILMMATALLHSVLGERRLIRPLLALETGIMASSLARRVLRFAWHLTSALMLACAFATLWPATPAPVLAAIGLAWLVPGILDAMYTRGRHIGWPLLVAAGALPLLHVLS